MSRAVKKLLKDYVNQQNYSTFDGSFNAMKEMLRDFLRTF